jgi:hypothetical protein
MPSLNLGGAEFVFDFTFLPQLPPTGMECTFYRAQFPEICFRWAGMLTSTPVLFALPGEIPDGPILSYPDNNGCQGSFWLYHNVNTNQSFVWFDITYGPADDQGEYEGAMVMIPKPTR